MYQFWLRRKAVAPALISLLVLAGCGTESNDTLGKAYVAPATLNLRGQLAQKNSTVAVLKHGERVSIVDVRRRFVKVRSANRVEGWVDSLDLLTPEQMDGIQKERRRALRLPSEGSATAYETLNIHIEPSRQSPPFAQIPEGVTVSVLAYRAAPRTAGPGRVPVFAVERAQPSHKPRKEKQSRSSVKLPPKPPPPKPPENWQQLAYGFENKARNPSAKPANATTTPQQSKVVEPEKPVVMEEWALVRTKGNQVGWVLARNLMMGIPDEVAQYAEGRRITSYFDLGSVNDEEKGLKHNWLWTTLGSADSFDFDSWRVFLWNRRRHRYETSHRQRDVEGYFPVEVDPPEQGAPGRTFSLITKDDDGKFKRRTYLFDGVRVHLTATEDYHAGAAGELAKPLNANGTGIASRVSRRSWFLRSWAALKHRVLGGS
jgi:hypothetical protein